MILVEGEKYACVQCIRGHRSSTCQHTKRPLVQVRSRGRPNAGADHRVAVFAEDQKDDKKSTSCCSSKSKQPTASSSCCSSKRESSPAKSPNELTSEKSCCKSLAAEHQPVIVLRASKKQLFNVSKGSISLLEPVAPELGAARAQTSSAGKHHHTRCSCCSKSRVSKPRKQSLKSPAATPSRSASSSVDDLGVISVNHNSRPMDMSEYIIRPVDHAFSAMNKDRPHMHDNIVYNMYYTNPSMDTNGCSCGNESCTCQHVPISVNNSGDIFNQINDLTNMFQNGNAFSPIATGETSAVKLEATNVDIPVINEPDLQGELFVDFMEDCSCQPNECACFNCSKHSIVNGIRLNDGARVCSDPSQSQDGTPVSEETSLGMTDEAQPLNKEDITKLLFNDLEVEELTDMLDCDCPPDDCNCTNCFKHGIFNNEIVNFQTPALQLIPKQDYVPEESTKHV